MAAGSLSRYFQTPLNATVCRWYPPRVTRCWMRVLGRLYFRGHPEERRRYLAQVRATLRGSSGRDFEQRVLSGVYDHYFEKMLSAYWGYERVRAYLLRRVQLVHADLMEGALRGGRGVILATGHFGAVEFLPGSLAFRGYPVTMVVKYKTPRLKRTMEGIARRAGVEALDADEGQVLPRALAAIRRGRIFITELDEIKSWRPSESKVMRFFGRRVRLDRSIEVLHRRTGAPVLLALVERRGGGYRLVFEPPQEHHAAPTGLGPDAQLLKRLEHYIYEAPDHWYLWKDLHHLEQLRPA